MARYVVLHPIEAVVSGGQRQRLSPGTRVVDTVGNQVAGDVIIGSAYSAAPVPPALQALDAAGLAVLTASAGSQSLNPDIYGRYNLTLNTGTFPNYGNNALSGSAAGQSAPLYGSGGEGGL
jgi:hypothetical protein